MILGHQIFGQGSEHVIVMHDWFGDSTSYAEIIPYLDVQTFTYAFVDLRGYGKSKAITGKYTVEEASQDVLEVAYALGWTQFHLVTHSISSMIAQRILVEAFEKVKSLVAIAPIPANGAPLPNPFMVFIQEAAISDDAKARRDHSPHDQRKSF